MARYTIREFTEVFGMDKDRNGLVVTSCVVKALCKLGIVREVGKRQGATGRPSLVYEVDDPITIPLNLGHHISSQKAVPQQKEEEPQQAVAVAASNQSFYYDDDDED